MFTFERISRDHELYQCQQRKSEGKWTGIRMAARKGLHTLVADDVHSLCQPRQLKRKGQLYTVHGLCSKGVEVPLLYALSLKKTS
ncbi:hypothetical protein Y032_0632g882 [Ancylostoma ceylanicum]|uniref:Uncharacterized protein n=1 Tax=Ancylostoma ceylanicum TaxID=53326 RepID=A0A016WKA7_9BILA|nr:hypothetical protein Y032_0632g882 [Ancylostoma ceylanicum]